MYDITEYAPFVIAMIVFATAAAGLAVATLVALAVDARGSRRSRPVVLITRESTATRAAA